jgi:hypothetical protein
MLGTSTKMTNASANTRVLADRGPIGLRLEDRRRSHVYKGVMRAGSLRPTTSKRRAVGIRSPGRAASGRDRSSRFRTPCCRPPSAAGGWRRRRRLPSRTAAPPSHRVPAQQLKAPRRRHILTSTSDKVSGGEALIVLPQPIG